MTTCPKCQAELEETARFCPHCGSPVAQSAAGGAGERPLVRLRDALLVVGFVAVAAAGIWIAYVAGNPMRYAEHLTITVEGVEKKVRKVRIYYRDEEVEREVVEVRGTVENAGSRNITELTATVSLRNPQGQVVGSCEEPLSTSAREEPYWYSISASFPAHAVTRFIVDVEPLTDDWVAEKTTVTITDLDFD